MGGIKIDKISKNVTYINKNAVENLVETQNEILLLEMFFLGRYEYVRFDKYRKST